MKYTYVCMYVNNVRESKKNLHNECLNVNNSF